MAQASTASFAESASLMTPPGVASSDARFSCNICLDAVTEPVVTQCGHLYCWPCLFRWLEPGMLPGERQSLGLPSSVSAAVFAINETRRVCPVCKAPCSVPSLVPLYVRTHSDDAATAEAAAAAAASNEEKEGREAPPDVSTPPQTPTPVEDATDGSPHDSTTEPESDAAAAADLSTGLRQRRGARREEGVRNSCTNGPVADRSEDNANAAATTTPVPARPPANSPTRTPSFTSSSSSPYPASAHAPPRSAVAMTPSNTLAVGRIQPPLFPGGNSVLARTFQHALTAAVEQSQQQQQPGTGGDAYQRYSPSGIPPLHRQEGHGNAAAAAAAAGAASSSFLQPDSLGDPDATEFLSRILLLLGSFVILCLLLF
jgi:Zinc finger, C3HC4 type (RING finger)